MRSTCDAYTMEEHASITRPVLDMCVDDVKVKGEDMLAHGGGFRFGLVGQRIEVQIRLPEEGEDLRQRVTKFLREKIACVGVEVVLQQLYKPEPAGAKPARAGPGSSLS